MKTKKGRGLSYSGRKALSGWCFISLWLVGTIFFFLIPLVKSLWYSFSSVSIGDSGLEAQWNGISNYIYAFSSDKDYADCLRQTLAETLWKTPLILIFSLFIAVVLNQKFRGRTLARSIFFLPVIIATGPVYKIIRGDMGKTGSTSAEQFSTMFSVDLVGDVLDFLGIHGAGELIQPVADNIFGIVWSSGIQILIFLAALQNIPASAREAAQIEGATAWEYFWKIIFPYVSPFILANLIFTAIDSFTSPENPVMERIAIVKENLLYGEASAMAWIYFLIVLASAAAAAGIINRFIYYETD